MRIFEPFVSYLSYNRFYEHFLIQFNYPCVRHYYQDIIILFTRGVWRHALKTKISSSYHFHIDQGVGIIIKASSFKTPGCRGLPRHTFWTAPYQHTNITHTKGSLSKTFQYPSNRHKHYLYQKYVSSSSRTPQ